MSRASDLRRTARFSLKGKWGVAVLAGFLASLLGATGSSIDIDYKTSENSTQISNSSGQPIDVNSLSEYIDPELAATIVSVIGIIALFSTLIALLIGSVVEIGYSKFNIDLIDAHDSKVGTLFSFFSIWGKAVWSRILRFIFTFLWALLLFIPGIIASYSYAMTSYILAEQPELSAREAITQSKNMMRGNRWRLFCLQMSFLGWAILCVFTLGIGSLWLIPYTNAATAAFYREVSDSYLASETA